MSLRATVAAPFLGRGTTELPRSEFVVELTLERGWFTPEQVEDLLTVATDADLLTAEGDTVALEIDPASVSVPDDFEPDESVLTPQTVFEAVLEALEAAGHDTQSAVRSINVVQAELDVTIEAAAVVAAARAGLDVSESATQAERAIREG